MPSRRGNTSARRRRGLAAPIPRLGPPLRRAGARSGWRPRKAQHRWGAIGCGVDVVELSRFRQAMARGGAAFMRRIFTPQEAAYARARRATTLLHLAGRFAAKEAVIKAISQIDPRHVPTMSQVEVCNDRLGRPSIVLHNRWRRRPQIHISLSHVDTVAVASAIAIG